MKTTKEQRDRIRRNFKGETRLVFSALDDIDLLESQVAKMRAALEEIAADTWDLKHGPHHWDRARDCLREVGEMNSSNNQKE